MVPLLVLLQVPEDFAPMLENLTYGEGDMELNVRHILKKCEVVIKMARNRPGQLDHHIHLPSPPALPRQHSSPAAVPTTASINHSNSAPSTPNPSSAAAHMTDPYPISTDDHPQLSTFDPPTTPYSLSSSPVDIAHHKQHEVAMSSISSPPPLSSPPSAVANVPSPQPLVRSQSSSQFDTNDNLQKSSLLV